MEGSLTPNQEAFGLLISFATGSVRMRGDVVQHLPTLQGNKSIGDSLWEIPWYSPKRRKVDGSVIHSKEAKITKKEPKKHLVKQNNASLLAKMNPHTQVPNSEIRPENIIPDSQEYVPYKKIKSTGQGKGIENIEISSDMPHHKQTPTRADRACAKAHKQLTAARKAKEMERKTTDAGEAPHKQLTAKAAHKTGASAGVKVKPRYNWALLALHEIRRYLKTVHLLIPLLPFQRLIREVPQDFRMELHFQSGAILAIQEVAEAFLVQLFESVNLCAFHRGRQMIAPKDFYLVKCIWHIAGINMWWV